MTIKYKQIKEEIKSWILEGIIQPDEKIQSEHELAESFGVSRHTIRQALSELVHEEWLYRQQGRGTFCKNQSKRNLKQIDRTIGIITTSISDYIFPSIIRGIESYLSEKGYNLILASTNHDISRERKCLENMLGKKLDGLIVEPTKSALYNPNLNTYLSIEKNHIPYVMINAFYSELQPASITVDDELGGFKAGEHLLRLGHRRIGGIFKIDDKQGVNRMKGFMRALREHNISILPGTMITFHTEDRHTKPIQEVQKLLKEANPPTAFFCYNDEIALMILNVLRDMQLKVPEDISIVGFDDSQLAVASEVKFTTLTHPQTEMGLLAAKMIVDALEEGKELSVNDQVVYEPELVIRNSTKDINKN
ncbi:arabinose metabolism transcriptional repressor [Robertmurraya siralis]|uniref:Arabinose metabolism transcriptional repressor n=1 Tax=Robertmurraya siralis TaxID=77777 RepID=A0A919WL67_9BACI|nr:GntR family transcriptional regulator [Robertmurraya siralis]PAE20828.1 GntR family transcriptional regulator [Bacillus sp. 7504-2]GIN63774.1 arabinose metabolism transcriptional repressor [Robertmurraya siralis]